MEPSRADQPKVSASNAAITKTDEELAKDIAQDLTDAMSRVPPSTQPDADPPNIIHLAERWTQSSTSGGHSDQQSSSFITTTTPSSNAMVSTDPMEQLKAQHAKELFALRRWYDEDLSYLRNELREAGFRNHELNLNLKRHQRTIADRDAQIFTLTSTGQAYSTEACALCGRIGERYVQDPSEPLKEKAPGTKKEENKLPSNGKAWDEASGAYILPPTRAPDHHHYKVSRIEALRRRRDGEPPEEGDDELIHGYKLNEEGLSRGGEEGGEADEDEVDEKGWKKSELPARDSGARTTTTTGGW